MLKLIEMSVYIVYCKLKSLVVVNYCLFAIHVDMIPLKCGPILAIVVFLALLIGPIGIDWDVLVKSENYGMDQVQSMIICRKWSNCANNAKNNINLSKK